MTLRSGRARRIAEVVPALRRTAPVFVACELARGFSEAGHDVEVLHLDAECEFDPGVPHRRVGWRDRDVLKGFDVVHSHMLRPDLLCGLGRPRGPDASRRVTTIHNNVREDLANTHGRLVAELTTPMWARAWRRLDARVVLSEDARGYYARLMPDAECICIPNGRSPHVVAARQLEEHDVLRALRARYRIVGANALVSPRKGLEQILHALSGLPEFAFVLAGSGPCLPGLIKLAGRLGLGERFLPLGFKADARDYLDAYDLYAMPSRAEGLPLALLEAAAAARPIVCSRLPVFLEVFDDREAAFFDLDDIEGLRHALCRAWQERAALGSAARARYEARYSLASMVTSYLALFGCLPEGTEGATLAAPTGSGPMIDNGAPSPAVGSQSKAGIPHP